MLRVLIGDRYPISHLYVHLSVGRPFVA